MQGRLMNVSFPLVTVPRKRHVLKLAVLEVFMKNRIAENQESWKRFLEKIVPR